MSDLLDQYESYAGAPLESAFSLPFAVYHDEQVYRRECESVFRREWVAICGERELPNPGDYYAFNLVGESIVIVRGKDEQLRALSNNCRHRGTQLLDSGFGNIDKMIVCPYHAWAYDDRGQLKGAPFSGNVAVEKSEHCLPQFLIDTYLGLVFINLDTGASPLSERLAGLAEYAEVFEPQRFDSALPTTEEAWHANWKLAMENAMESYHLFKVHKDTLETVTPTKQAYYVAGSAEWSLTGGKMLDNSSTLSKWFRGDYPEAYDHYLLICLPPSFVGIMTYDSFGWLTVLPVDSEHSEIRAAAVAPQSSAGEDKQSQEFTAAFFAEDKWICERVQKSMHSELGSGGKLVEMERVVVDFHQFLAARLFGCENSPFYQNPEGSVFHSAKAE